MPINSDHYELFLFDADDTLFDFRASEKAALKSTLSHFSVEVDFEQFHTTYKAESFQLWQQLEQGTITKDFLRVERFRKTLGHFEKNLNPEEVGEFYLTQLPEIVHLNKNAKTICRELSKKARVGIVTNGIAEVQKKRLANSGLEEYISFMVVSEDCGHTKPDARFFKHTLEKANSHNKDGMLVIGDRLETDIEGANRFGINSCWYNPHRSENNSSTTPHYEIRDLMELY